MLLDPRTRSSNPSSDQPALTEAGEPSLADKFELIDANVECRCRCLIPPCAAFNSRRIIQFRTPNVHRDFAPAGADGGPGAGRPEVRRTAYKFQFRSGLAIGLATGRGTG